MTGLLKKAGLGMALAATALTTAGQADAQRYGYRGYGHYGHYGRGGDVAAGALLGGIVGLGVGAAIANSNRGYYDGYYNRGYGYDSYYAQPYYRDYYRPRCFTEFRFDPYYGGRVPVRVCR